MESYLFCLYARLFLINVISIFTIHRWEHIAYILFAWLILPFKKGLEIFVNRIEIVNVSVFLQVIIAAVTIFICMIVIQKSQMMMEIFGVKKK